MLKLGFKYQIHHIHSEALRRLSDCFPDNLEEYKTRSAPEALRLEAGWLFCVTCAAVYIELEDAIAVVNLARMFDLDCLLPGAFYVCAQLPSNKLVSGFKDDIGRQWKLSAEDLERCLDGQRELRQASTRSFSWLLRNCGDCKDPEDCKAAVRSDLRSIWPSMSNMPDALVDWDALQNLQYDTVNVEKYCKECSRYFKRKFEEERQVTWNNLRTYFKLPPRPKARLVASNEV